MASTSTQFVTSRRMGIYDPLQQISMWDDGFGANLNPNTSPGMMMMTQVDSRLANKVFEITKVLYLSIYLYVCV